MNNFGNDKEPPSVVKAIEAYISELSYEDLEDLISRARGNRGANAFPKSWERTL